jgi:hypothetical protein
MFIRKRPIKKKTTYVIVRPAQGKTPAETVLETESFEKALYYLDRTPKGEVYATRPSSGTIKLFKGR